ncbi:MAG: hypothetical protein ABH896_00330 [Candidatus Jacksonbacteria bacterium]
MIGKYIFNKNSAKQKDKQKLKKTHKKTKILLTAILLAAIGFFLTSKTKIQAQNNLETKTQPPAPTILIPQNPNITTAKPVIAGVSLNNTIVEIYLNDILTGQTQTNNHPSGVGNFFWHASEPLNLKAHLIKTRAIDINTQQASDFSDELSINIIPFGGPALLLPDQLILTKPLSYVEGVAHNDSFINIFIDGISVENFSLGSHSSFAVGFKHTLSHPITSGEHTIYIQAKDQTGRVSLPTAIKTFKIIDFPAPSLIAPASNLKTVNTNPVIEGFAFNDSLVKIFIDGIIDGEIKVQNHPSQTAHFLYTIKNPLTIGQFHNITAKAEDPRGRISQNSNNIQIFTQYFYIPPTLLGVKDVGARALVYGVAHNDSSVHLLIDGKLDSAFTPDNHPSGTLYFEAYLNNPVTYGTHQITAQAFDSSGKPSKISNVLYYTLKTPESVAPASEIEVKEPESTKKEEASQEDISVQEKEDTGKIEIIEPDPAGQIETPDEKEGATNIDAEKLAEEEAVPLDAGLATTTNWPLLFGIIILIGLAIIFIGWYLGQKRKLLNEGIDKLFSEEEKSFDAEPLDNQAGAKIVKSKKEKKNKIKEQNSFIDDLPPPPPAI